MSAVHVILINKHTCFAVVDSFFTSSFLGSMTRSAPARERMSRNRSIVKSSMRATTQWRDEDQLLKPLPSKLTMDERQPEILE